MTGQVFSAARRTHGHSGDNRTYKAWKNMKDRCYNPRAISYPYYGGRGITVCEAWRDSFEVFLEDMGECPHDLSLDRIDNTAHYGPSNCRWATRIQQHRNKRNNHLVTFKNQTHCIAEWVEITGISRGTIRSRLRRGWSVERVLTEPVHK